MGLFPETVAVGILKPVVVDVARSDIEGREGCIVFCEVALVEQQGVRVLHFLVLVVLFLASCEGKNRQADAKEMCKLFHIYFFKTHILFPPSSGVPSWGRWR